MLIFCFWAAAASASRTGTATERLTWEPTPAKQFNSEVALVNRDEMEDALTKLFAMEKKLEEAKHESEYLLHMKETQWAEKLNAVTAEMVCYGDGTRAHRSGAPSICEMAGLCC